MKLSVFFAWSDVLITKETLLSPFSLAAAISLRFPGLPGATGVFAVAHCFHQNRVPGFPRSTRSVRHLPP
jgi:hypothetical protein